MDRPPLVSSAEDDIEINPDLPTLLLVDDTLINLELLEDIFEDDYNIPVAPDGETAWALLEAYPDLFDTVLLDRMMPDILGEEVLARMKQHAHLQYIPVIFQTAKASGMDMKEGLQAGADYYITKPYDEDQLVAVTRTAVNKGALRKKLQKEMKRISETLAAFSLAQEGVMIFKLRTIEEVEKLSFLLAHVCPNPDQVVTGLIELCCNAVEHGIAKIGYDAKSELKENDTWKEEVDRRLGLPENQDKVVSVQLERLQNEDRSGEIRFVVTDPGDGFDHEKYREIDENRIFDNHGRGIAMGATLSFDELFYNEKGNQVTALIKVPA